MPSPPLTSKQADGISVLVAEYTSVHKRSVHSFAQPLNSAQREAMEGFLPPQVLDTTLLLTHGGGTRVKNPRF